MNLHRQSLHEQMSKLTEEVDVVHKQKMMELQQDVIDTGSISRKVEQQGSELVYLQNLYNEKRKVREGEKGGGLIRTGRLIIVAVVSFLH